jgi:uncharacterized membrane protein YphA (DoxX/SURF4 family)
MIAAVSGIFLVAGLWTPVLGTAAAIGQLWFALGFRSIEREDMWIHVFLAVTAASLAMLGPGAWSIDARLFGRKRFDLRLRGTQPPSK